MQHRQEDQQHPPDAPQCQAIKRLLLVTDTWQETNGVTTTRRHTVAVARARGYDISLLHPGMFPNVPNPFYPQYRHAVPNPWRIRELLRTLQPDAVHILTEGPLGLVGRQECLKRGWRFTTSFHTRLDEHGKHLVSLPPAVTWKWVRWFHANSYRVLVPTRSMATLLRTHAFSQPIAIWERGIDTETFYPRPHQRHGVRRPIRLYVGRLSREKNLAAFLNLDLAGTKYVVGDGPMLTKLQRQYQAASTAGRVIFSGNRRAKPWRSYTPKPTCSSFPVRRIRLAMSSSRHWPLACRLPRIQFQDRAT